ncbi:MAG: HigA family addiction module antidote protein [Propionibacteriaceae bacterium]|nr:HigA family addiction module antidote protein [Propionibacteriaceae bacterium]
MAMMHPPHPGRLLRADIEALALSVAEAAEGLGVTRQQLYNVLNGKSAVTPEMAVRLEKGIGSTAETWLNLQTAYDLSQARARTSAINIERLASKHVATSHPLS